MMETGPVLETLCLEELKRMDIFQILAILAAIMFIVAAI
jgi:hypothetical protein